MPNPQGRPSPAGFSRFSIRPVQRPALPDLAELGVSKTAIAKITGVSRTALYSFMTTRGLRLSR